MKASNIGGSRPRGELHAGLLRCKELDGAVVLRSQLSARVLRVDGSVEDLGMIATKCVTDAFVEFVVDQLQAESSEFGDFKYHASGTGDSPGETAGDTALQTEVETPRAGTGTQIEGATGNIYKSVETITYTGTHGIVEHGLFNAATGPTLMDRSVFSVISVNDGDKIEFTYEITFSSGS